MKTQVRREARRILLEKHLREHSATRRTHCSPKKKKKYI